MDAFEQFLKGRIAFDDEEYEHALGHFRAALDLDENSKTHGLIAEALLRLGDTTAAFLHAERAYELSPLNDDVCVAYAEHLVRRGEREEALRIVRVTLERNRHFGPAEILRMTLEH